MAKGQGAGRRPRNVQALPDDREKDRILDAALALAAERGWDRIHLHDVADRLDLPLSAVRRLFPDMDAVGNRLFYRADLAMLALREEEGFGALPVRERIHRCLMRWLNSLAGHRGSVRRILGYKLAPAHIHHQAAMVVALSRTVQWLREAAMLEAAGRRRAREEVALTLLFVATLGVWFLDRSNGQERTRAFLRRRLDAPFSRLLWPGGEPPVRRRRR